MRPKKFTKEQMASLINNGFEIVVDQESAIITGDLTSKCSVPHRRDVCQDHCAERKDDRIPDVGSQLNRRLTIPSVSLGGALPRGYHNRKYCSSRGPRMALSRARTTAFGPEEPPGFSSAIVGAMLAQLIVNSREMQGGNS